ncbi:MAG: hypothetical protein QM754_02915 [Tepidisphaeraceae bacterium]
MRELLKKAADKADLAAKAAVENWPAGERAYDVADEQKTIANYTRAIVAYSQAIATGKADASRDAMLADAIKQLSEFDSEDNPDRASVKFYIAKLNLARGTTDSLTAAADGFAYAIKNGQKNDVRMQFDARLLMAGVRLAQNRLKDADTAVDEFLRYARSAGLDASVIDVALAGVRYRQAVANQRPEQADAELDRLQNKRPELRGLVLELIAARIDDAAPAASLTTLGLQARLARAESETLKPAGQTFDRAAIQRGVEAARLLLSKKDGTPQTLDSTAYVLPFFLQKIDDDAGAAAAFLDYIERYRSAGKTDRVSNAFEQAVSIVGKLFRATPDDPTVTRLYDRTLATAYAAPLNRADFAYEYARRLQAQGKADEAVAVYRKVPADDKNFGQSRYYLMVAVRQQIDRLPAADPQRPALLKELAELTDVVNASIAERLKSPQSPAAALLDRTRLAQTKLLAADVALREQKDAARAAKALDGFESAAKDLPNEASLLGEALLIRVQAFVQLNDINRATDQLVILARQDPAGAGQVVYNLLEKLDSQVTAAEAAGRDDEIGRLERNRALLTPFLVSWAEKHPDERIRKLAYTYRVFDADTQRRAAEKTADAAERKRLLDGSLQRFKELDDKPNVTAYLDSLPADRRGRTAYDPQVKLGLARTYFAQGDWTNARLNLATLFNDKVLGSGFVTTADAAGNFESRENPAYWEAMLRLIETNVNLGENKEAMKNLLAEQSVIYGPDLGGRRWHGDFVRLVDRLAVPMHRDSEPRP